MCVLLPALLPVNAPLAWAGPGREGRDDGTGNNGQKPSASPRGLVVAVLPGRCRLRPFSEWAVFTVLGGMRSFLVLWITMGSFLARAARLRQEEGSLIFNQPFSVFKCDDPV